MLLVLAASGGKISGKTLLQKRLYFVSLKLKKDLRYKAHYYGPYSAEINASLSECVGLDFVEAKTSGFGVADQAGYEVRRYDYVLTDEGVEMVEDLKTRPKQEYDYICQTLNVLEKAGAAKDYQDLSIVAKTMHIVGITSDGIVASHDYGWDLRT